MLLKIENLKKEYRLNKKNKQLVLKNISLEFKSGEFVCIYGESGSGKSTLMNIIGGLDNEYEGNVYIDNKSLKKINIDEYKRENIGFVFQKFNLISHFTVLENVMIALDTTKIKRRAKIKRAKDILIKLGLRNHIYKRPNQLSGGQMQRVAIARALIKNPDIILADEPTGSLDAKNSENILQILSDISKSGKLVIIVTHSNKVKKYSNRIITIEDGSILKDQKFKHNIKYNKRNKLSKKNLSTFTCFKFGINNIIKNLKRNFLLSLASSIGIIGITLCLFIGSGVKKYIEREVKNNINPLLFNISKKGVNELYDITYFEEDEIDKIKDIKNVKTINKDVSFSSNSYILYNDKKYDLVNLSSFDNMKKSDLKYGNIPDNNEIVISQYLARDLSDNLNDLIGKEVEIFLIDSSSNEPFLIRKKLTISGIYKNSKVDLINNTNYAYVKYSTISKIYNNNDRNLKPTNLSLEVNKKDNIDYVKSNIEKMGYKLTNTYEYAEGIFKYLDIATFILSCFSSVSLIVSCIMIIIVFNINVMERTKEIGIFKALGFRKKDIKKIFKTEAFLIGLFTSIISFIFSSLIAKNLSNLIYNSYKINIIDINIKYVIFASVISIFVCLVGCINPASKAAKLNTIDSLRYE
ncbi:MAG: ATP-binding cassette domain-containing protein [Bacilli bacterium]|nr:ATP-binding cassette domain-containing protein [Bacilli bacterium]